MLKLNNIEKSFNINSPDKVKVFDNFNLNINEGSFVSLVGANGSGKTTLLNLIYGNLSLDGGKIFLADNDITSLPTHKRAKSIARVYQEPGMGTAPSMTILDNLSIADNKGKHFNFGRAVDKKRIDFYRENLATVGLGLENKLNSVVGSLSGGQRQALTLIMSTMADVKLLLLDEHTAALDPSTAETIMEITANVIKNKHLTAIMVTHNLSFATTYGDRLIMLNRGEISLDKVDGKVTKLELMSLFN